MILRNDKINRFIRSAAAFLLFALLALTVVSPAVAAHYTVTPSTWNIIGLDSNRPDSGPYQFPVGAKFCGGTPGATDTALLTWETGGTDNGTYIYLRSGTANPVNIIFGADGCADAYFEAEVAQTSLAFGQTRRYYITAGGVSTPRPRELYVERLIAQGRNSVNALYVDGVLVTTGNPMSLVAGNTYSIKVVGQTANAYSQFEEFINFSSAIFQILSVNTNYTSNSSPYVSTSNHKYLYADACRWDNDPNSPNYRSCLENYGTGGTVDTTYSIKILSGTPQTLNTLFLDNSGGSFHYNNNFFPGGVGAVTSVP